MSFDSLDEIRVFNQVVLSGGFSAAAESLKVPTNIASRRVASLESALGVRLLNRTTRKLSLTPEGELLFQRSQQLLADFDTLEKQLNKSLDPISGSLRIAVRTTTVEFGLLDALTYLLQQHNNLEIQLLVSDMPLDVIGAGIDLALMIGELPSSSLVAKKIGEVVFCLCASKHYVTNPDLINSPQDLTRYNYILPWQKTSGYSLALRKYDGIIENIEPSSRFQSNDVRTRAAAVYAGLGIGALPYAEVEAKIAEGTLVRILPEYTLPFIPVWSVKPKEKRDDPRLRLIESALGEVVIKMGQRPQDNVE